MKALVLFLLLLVTQFAFGQRSSPFDKIAQDVERGRPSAEILANLPPTLPPDAAAPLRRALKDLPKVKNSPGRTRIANRVRALGRAAEFDPTNDAAATVAAIKQRGLYKVTPKDANANWIGRSIARLLDWLRKLFERDADFGPAPSFRLPTGLTYVVWGLLAALVLAALFPLVRLLRERARRAARRKKGGLLADEPDRTRDEYLRLADALAAKGEYREALRMIYVATLKRFDEARVARFDRGETNWEHLARIQASPKLPPGLDFRPATKAFDLHWYGERPANSEVYDRFVGWYQEAERRLSEPA